MLPPGQQMQRYAPNGQPLPGAPAGASTQVVAQAAPAAPAAADPSYLSQMFPNGTPTSNAPTDTSSIVNSIMAALSPQFAQQQAGLTDSLANAGIVGGSTVGAEGALGNQQQQQALSQISPAILQGLNMNLGQSEFNVDNLLRSGMYDSGVYNQFLGQNIGNKNQDWLAQLQAQSNLNSGAAGAQTGAFQPVFQQPAPANFMGLAQGLAPNPSNGGGGGGFSGINNVPGETFTGGLPSGVSSSPSGGY